jgi:hypothetical protein
MHVSAELTSFAASRPRARSFCFVFAVNSNARKDLWDETVERVVQGKFGADERTRADAGRHPGRKSTGSGNNGLYGDWIAYRYVNVARAVARLGGERHPHRLNPHIGKFNCTFSAITAQEVLAAFEAELLPLLEAHEPSRAA